MTTIEFSATMDSIGSSPDPMPAAGGLPPAGASLDPPAALSQRRHRPMPFEWTIFLKILLAILRILQALPKDVDTTDISGHLADAIEANGIRP